MNAKISVVVICVEAIIYLLLHNLHDCTFKFSQLIEIIMDNIFKKNFARFGGLGFRSKSFTVHQFITINQKD